MRRKRTLQIAGVAAAVTLMAAACTPPGSDDDSDNGAGASAAPEDVPETPSEPVSLHILDVAGNAKLTEGMVEQYVEENPDVISSVSWESGGAPDLVGAVKPQVESGDITIDLVLTGNDGLSAGIDQDLWVPLVDDFSDRLTNQANYIEPAAAMQELAEGYGVVVTYYPSGPLLQYDPEVVSDVPTTPQEVLDWAEAHPSDFGYARPANSGPGRTWLMGLPYILGDEDPSDPENGWDKTWDYLAELDQYIDAYPTGTGQVISNMADGTWAMTPITTGWDIEPRATDREPARIEAAAFDDFTWVTDAHYAVVPKGQSADKLSAIVQMLNYMLTPEVNAMAYDHGYFYPGPAVEGATLDLAPKENQQVIEEFGRDWYDDLIDSMPTTTPLPPDTMVQAFDIWDRQIGSGKYEGS